jgi:hypothetical protein
MVSELVEFFGARGIGGQCVCVICDMCHGVMSSDAEQYLSFTKKLKSSSLT